MNRTYTFKLLGSLAGLVAFTLAVGATHPASGAGKPGADGKLTATKKPVATLDYIRDVRPILSDKCFKCHGADPKAIQAGLRLDTRDGALQALADGKHAIVAGNPRASELVKRITLPVDAPGLMPPASTKKVLTADEKRILATWVAEGAVYKPHWAFVKPTRPPLPTVKLASWPHNDIDRFLLARLEKEGLRPSPPADRITLLRRVTLDLTGLPPTTAEVSAFLADRSPESKAYEKAVDRLLASPRYGERMAQSWLDGARYADSNGYQADYERFQWLWRDWVINAFNQNMPFDRFTIEQLAGDMLPNASLSQKIATGFNRNHRINTEGGVIAEEWRIETVIDRVETTSAVWLGLTMGCGRCHDHKYDPITQKEFYQFSTYFNNVPESGSGAERPVNHPPIVSAPTPEQTSRLTALDAELQKANGWLTAREAANTVTASAWKGEEPEGSALNTPITATPTTAPTAKGNAKTRQMPRTGQSPIPIALLSIAPEKRTEAQKREVARLWSERFDPEYQTHAQAREQLTKERDTVAGQISTVMVMAEMPQPRDCFILIRGQYDKHGEKVTSALPAAFGTLPTGAPNNRLGLALWIASPDNPLTARVAVNRLWEKFFGIGIVPTTEDFGTRAEYPTHPELLDWLATEFVRLKWDLKAMQKEILMSAAYQQASKVTPALQQRDPDNRLLARGPRFRLPAEVIRDQALAVSGLLVEKLGGPSVRPYQPDGIWDELNVYGNLRNYRHDQGDNLYRRSLYTIWKRTSAPPLATIFDVPGREMCRVRRSRTNTPLQALALMNDVTFVEAARVLAQRMITEGGTTPENRLSYAFNRVLSRRPSAEESRILLAGLRRFQSRYAADSKAATALVSQGDTPRDPKIDVGELAAYTMTASILLNMDETITKE